MTSPPKTLFENPETAKAFDLQARKLQRQFWDDQAANWAMEETLLGLQPTHLDKVVTHLTAPLLVIGAGQGLIQQALFDRGVPATGVDWSSAMVEMGNMRGIEDLICADADDLPFKDGEFATVVLSTGVLMPTHSKDRIAAYFSEVRRVLEPKGMLIVAVLYEKGSEQARTQAQNVQHPVHAATHTKGSGH